LQPISTFRFPLLTREIFPLAPARLAHKNAVLGMPLMFANVEPGLRLRRQKIASPNYRRQFPDTF
jgi:hypothetical protein